MRVLGNTQFPREELVLSNLTEKETVQCGWVPRSVTSLGQQNMNQLGPLSPGSQVT